MPGNTIVSNSVNQTQYYKLNREVTYTKEWAGKKWEATSPAFTRYNKLTKKEEFCFNSFGGRLVSLKLGEPKEFFSKKTAQPFIVQNLYLEFHSKDENKELVTEIITLDWFSKFAKLLLGKLYRTTDFTWIDLLVGRINDKEDPTKHTDFLAVYQGKEKIKLPNFLSPKYEGKEYHKDTQFIPQKRYLQKGEKGVFETTTDYSKAVVINNNKVVDPDWEEEIKSIYELALETVRLAIIKFNENYTETITATTPAVEEIVDEYTYEPVNDINFGDTSVDMPF